MAAIGALGDAAKVRRQRYDLVTVAHPDVESLRIDRRQFVEQT
jgi:hypothetical protein